MTVRNAINKLYHVTIDGTEYHFTPQDLPEELRTYFSNIEKHWGQSHYQTAEFSPSFPCYAIAHPEATQGAPEEVISQLEMDCMSELVSDSKISGRFVIHSDAPPLPEIDPDVWQENVTALQTTLAGVSARTYTFDTERRPAEFDWNFLPIHAVSTFSNTGMATGDEDPYYQVYMQYMQAYGFEKPETPASADGSYMAQISCPTQNGNANTFRIGHDSLSSVQTHRALYWNNNGFQYGYKLCFETIPVDAEAAAMFREANHKYAKEIDLAVQGLALQFPHIAPQNLRLALLNLWFYEWEGFDHTDIQQEMGAANLAGSPLQANLEKAFQEDGDLTQLKNDLARMYAGRGEISDESKYFVASSSIAGAAWAIYSKAHDIPLDSQGIGPLQIIIGLPRAAYVYERDLFSWYESKGILSNDDFRSNRALLKATQDPQKMFALKAMTMALQLRGFVEQNFAVPKLATPQDLPDGTATQVGQLYGMEFLVQVPERTKDFSRDAILFHGYGQYIARLHLLGDIVGVPPQLPGVDKHIGSYNSQVDYAFQSYELNGQTVYLTVPRSESTYTMTDASSQKSIDKSQLPSGSEEQAINPFQ